jgi:hypothetical protein
MPLVNLTTNLKSLRYGGDRRGQGSSNQPYVTTPIPNGEGPGLDDVDFILRGGSLSTGAVAKDISRLTQMMFDLKTPNGLLFSVKQNLLSRSGVNIKAQSKINKLALNNGIYLPTSTLAQAAVNPIGGHLLKQGINPIFDTSEAAARGDVGGILSFLTGSSLPLSNPIYFSTKAFEERINNEKTSRLIGFLENNQKQKDNDNILYSYSGGPNSTLGIGKTTIKALSDQRTGINNKYANIPSIKKSNEITSDFRQTSPNKDSNPKSINYTDKSQSLDGRVKHGSPGDISGARTSYVQGKGTSLDKINALQLYKSEDVNTGKDVNDLCKFRIGVIDNDTPELKTYIHFRAFLDSMDDNYSADWGAQTFSGRAENLYNYQGFDRNFNLSWTVTAQSKQELIPMYQKLNYLASVCAPDYSSDGYMRGNLIELTVGGYLHNQIGIMKGISFTVPQESPWEIGINETGGSDPNVKELPFMIKVSGFSFIPIHNFVPNMQKNDFNGSGELKSFGKERYISLSNTTHQNYTKDGSGIKTQEQIMRELSESPFLL